MASTDKVMDVFNTGANRNISADKLDYEGFLSPDVLVAYAEFMHRNRRLPDGTIRDSDNWQLGIPKANYAKSLIRHVLDVWLWHRGSRGVEPLKTALCAVIFNAMGYLSVILKEEGSGKTNTPVAS